MRSCTNYVYYDLFKTRYFVANYTQNYTITNKNRFVFLYCDVKVAK